MYEPTLLNQKTDCGEKSQKYIQQATAKPNV